MIYDMALPLAEKLRDLLLPACPRIEIAGSVRRLKEDVGDIELVCTPDTRSPRLSFGSHLYMTRLDALCGALEHDGDDDIRIHQIMGGDRYKKFWVSMDGGNTWVIKLDLFIVRPPSDWGVEYLIRTGPKEFSHWIVTPRFLGGGLPDGYRVEAGQVLSQAGEYIPCREEIDFLRFCRLDWIEPKNRRPIWQRSARKIQAREMTA
jgi:DNA polymerase/3'-5' exonuclease PolX